MATAAPAGRPLSRDIALTGLANVGILAMNFATGVLVARLLGASGRGQAAVIATLAQLVGWLAALGINEGLQYLSAKRPEDTSRMVGTAFVLAAVLGTVGTLVALVLLPVVVGSDDTSLAIGRFFMFTIFLSVATGLLTGVLSGNQDFVGTNMVRFVQPATYLLLLVAFAVATDITVGRVLAAAAGSTAVATGVTAVRLLRTVGVGPPSMAVAKEAGRYGLRIQGSLLGGIGTGRLDFLILPSYLAASAIGLYSVAVNVSSIVASLVGAVGNILLPAAVRRGDRQGSLLVARMLRLTLLAATAASIPVAIFAPHALGLVYGEEFRGAATPLRILLPGVVLGMGSGIVSSGLEAVNRPLAASICQLFGLGVTVVGLLVTLGPLGINGAALTTSVAWGVAFLTGLIFLRSEEHFPWRTAFGFGGVVSDVRSAIKHARPAATRRRHGHKDEPNQDGAGKLG